MGVNLYLLESTGNLSEYKKVIKSAFDTSVEKATSKLPLKNIDVVVRDNPRAAIPEIGIGGRTSGPNTVFIAVNPQFPALDQTLEENMIKTLLHEFHHCARWAKVGYGDTLLEALISEGLADHFQVEVTGGNPPPWSIALAKEEIERALILAKADYDNDKYDHRAWFFGSKEKGIRRWAGYTLGFELVSNYLKNYPKESASSLFSLEAKEFLI